MLKIFAAFKYSTGTLALILAITKFGVFSPRALPWLLDIMPHSSDAYSGALTPSGWALRCSGDLITGNSNFGEAIKFHCMYFDISVLLALILACAASLVILTESRSHSEDHTQWAIRSTATLAAYDVAYAIMMILLFHSSLSGISQRIHVMQSADVLSIPSRDRAHAEFYGVFLSCFCVFCYPAIRKTLRYKMTLDHEA